MAVLTPNDPVAAGRLTPTDRQHMLKSGRSFAVETTLAGASTLKLMRTHPCRHRPEMWCLISPNATGSSSSTTCSTRNSLRASWKGRGLRRGMSARSLRMMRFVRSASKKSAADWLSGYFFFQYPHSQARISEPTKSPTPMSKTMMYGVLIASPSGINHRNAAAFRNSSAAASRTELSVTGPKSARLVPLQCRHQLTFRSFACRARLSHTQKPLRYACRHGRYCRLQVL